MLPDSIFSKGIIWSDPLEFKLPEIYHGYLLRNSPEPVWDMWLYETASVVLGETKSYGLGGGDADGNVTFAEIHMFQYDVYGFIIVYDLIMDPIYIGRRIHLQGFFHEKLSRRTCNKEPFQALQGDFFEIAISLHDRDWKPIQAALLESFEWRLWDEDDNLVLTYTLGQVLLWHDQVRFRLTPTDTNNLVGNYTHEASCILGGKRYSLLVGSAVFVPTRILEE